MSGLKHHLVQWKEFLDKWRECEVIAGYETFIPFTSYIKPNIVEINDFLCTIKIHVLNE